MVPDSLSCLSQTLFFSDIKLLVVHLPISVLLDSLSLRHNFVVKPVFDFGGHVFSILAMVYKLLHLIEISKGLNRI